MIILVLVLYAALIVFLAVRVQIKASDIASSVWEQQVAQLRAVQTTRLNAIALGAHRDARDHTQHSIDEALRVIGGVEGLERLQTNCRVLFSLASCQSFSSGDEIASIKQMRSAMWALRWRIPVLRMFLLVPRLRSESYTRLKQVAELYCDMVATLISVYAETHVGRRDQIIAACNL